MKKFITSSSALWSCLIAVVMMMSSQSAMAEYVKLTALSGTGGTGGEGYASLVDAKTGTKMGHSFDPSNPDRAEAWIVVKAEKAVVPDWYFLVTGNDTGSYPTRNWKRWNIYGGNFENDADAVRGDVTDPSAGGWTLIDERDGEALPQANTASANFQFNEVDGVTAYQYFWIEILESVQGSDIWLQMGEWGLGTFGDFEKYLEDLANTQTGTDEPVIYTIISGDRNDSSGEGLAMLFDGDISTKWGNGFNSKDFGATSGGAYFIVKTSRAMTPTYYKLVTGNDNASWNHRNWKSWQIYGIAAADAPNGKPDRASDKWVLIDRKDNITEEVLPDKNMFTVMFNLDPGTTEAYQYFKVEIDDIMSGGGYMQMGEFSLGDEYTLVIDRAAIVEKAEQNYDPDLFAEKALVDQLGQAIEDTKNCNNPFELSSLNTSIDELSAQVAASAGKYAELITARNQAVNLIAEDNLKDAALVYLTAWIDETNAIAPSEDYPAGNFGYIKANRQLTGEQASVEAKRISEYIVVNVKVVDDPIYVTYETIIDANGFNDGEMGHSLIDGDRESTKWCASTDHKPWRLIFKSSDPIKPTYYGLVTGGDTYSYPDRNWKSWKIWAANFDSDEDVTEESENWVLIDEKNNVGTDVLKTTNVYESYINLSIGCTEPYQYFKIIVEASGGSLIQMNEFTFYNQGNLDEYRESFIEEFSTPEEIEGSYVAYQGYIDAYKATYDVLQGATNPPDVMKAYNELKEALENLESSSALYEEYQSVYEEVVGVDFDSESMTAWQAGYTSENEGPSNIYIRGTYEYITSNLSLDNDGIQAEIAYLRNIRVAAEEGLYILLGGHTEGQWGDGFYGHLININKNGDVELGSDEGEVKWGGQADANGNTYIIFRTLDKTNPFFYTLTTGNDTEAYWGRNWGTWYIYGANFEGDGDATKDAEGWVLVDAKENVGQDRLHPVNNQPSYFGFSTETTEKYTYYKVVVTKAYDGSAIQMNELHFGTEEEFEEIRNQYKDAAEEFDTFDVLAQQSLLDEYDNTIDELDDCTNMEVLFRINYQLESLRDAIASSIASYAKYQQAVEDNKAYLQANKLADSEAKTIFENYLNKLVINPKLYPNGTSVGILFEHEVGDSILAVEMDFMESLKAAAVAAGYGPGMEISSLIVNRTFKKAGEMLKDKEGNELGREAEGWDGYIYRTATDAVENDIYAAELCVGNAKFDISQTLTDMKNGYYKVTLNAGYRPNGDVRSFNHAAMAYANDMKTYVPVVREYMIEDKDASWQGDHYDRAIYAVDVPGTDPTGDPAIDSVEVGYVIWGCEGAAHAFAQGRYAITLVTQVTDGKLTIGVKNEGTLDNEWTGIGNFGLVYLGEEESAATAALQEVADYNAERIITLTELYVSDAEDEENYPAAPGFGVAQKESLNDLRGVATFEAEKAIGEIMQSIYETKKAYAELMKATTKVYNKWYEYAGVTDAEDAIFDIRYEKLAEGLYDDEVAAKAALTSLYESYPAYLEVKNDKGTNIDYNREEFVLDIITTGVNPSLELTGLYEALAEKEVILEFDYTAPQDVEGGYFYYETPNLLTEIKEAIPTLKATNEWTTVSVDLSKGVKELGFGSETNHSLFWGISSKANKETSFELSVRNFRFVKKEGVDGDLNGDSKVDIADAVTVLNIMASNEYVKAADLNDDGKVDIADFVTILNMMAAQ